MVRRIATEPKTGFTGVVFVASFAMFRPVMAISNAGATLLWPFCRCRLSRSVMVEMRGKDEEAMRKNPSLNEYGRPPRYRAPHQLAPFEENIAPRPQRLGTDDRLITRNPFLSLFSHPRVLTKCFTRWPPVQRFVEAICYTTLPPVGLNGCNLGAPPFGRPLVPPGNQGSNVHRSPPTPAMPTEIFHIRILAVWTTARYPRTRNPIYTPRNTARRFVRQTTVMIRLVEIYATC